MLKARCLNNNYIKILACVFMFIDHFGLIFYPEIKIFRVIGRFAFPIFGYLIAEGCKYTKNKLKHFLTLFIFAFVCQFGYYLYNKSLYMSVLVTFTLSQACIFSLQFFKKCLFEKDIFYKLTSGILFGVILSICIVFCQNFEVDYGIFGVTFPLICSLFDFKGIDVKKAVNVLDNFYVSLGLFFIANLTLVIGNPLGNIQFFSLLSLPILLLYNEKKGKLNLKYFFYVFYPVHLIALEFVAMLI